MSIKSLGVEKKVFVRCLCRRVIQLVFKWLCLWVAFRALTAFTPSMPSPPSLPALLSLIAIYLTKPLIFVKNTFETKEYIWDEIDSRLLANKWKQIANGFLGNISRNHRFIAFGENWIENKQKLREKLVQIFWIAVIKDVELEANKRLIDCESIVSNVSLIRTTLQTLAIVALLASTSILQSIKEK